MWLYKLTNHFSVKNHVNNYSKNRRGTHSINSAGRAPLSLWVKKILHIHGNSVTDYPMATIREKRSSVPSLASEAVAAKRRHTSAGFQGKENAAPCSRPSGSKKPRLAPERLSQVPGSIREMGRGESTV